MSGGGKIIEKALVKLQSDREVIRYWVMDGSDEVCVYAEPAADEPQLGDSIMWGGEQVIYFGPDECKRLTKVGYSFRLNPTMTGDGHDRKHD
jgi:hypothetical protein